MLGVIRIGCRRAPHARTAEKPLFNSQCLCAIRPPRPSKSKNRAVSLVDSHAAPHKATVPGIKRRLPSRILSMALGSTEVEKADYKE